MTYIDDAGKECFDDQDLDALEELGYDTENMSDEELTNAYNQALGDRMPEDYEERSDHECETDV
jgi:hypothetical protein